MVGHGATSCNRRPGSSLDDLMMEDATDEGNHTSVPRLDTVEPQVRLVAARFTEELGHTESVNTNQAMKFGS